MIQAIILKERALMRSYCMSAPNDNRTVRMYRAETGQADWFTPDAARTLVKYGWTEQAEVTEAELPEETPAEDVAWVTPLFEEPATPQPAPTKTDTKKKSNK